MDDDNILKDLFADRTSKKTLVAVYSFVMLVLSYHAIIYFVVDAERIIDRNVQNEYTVTFVEEGISTTDSRVVADGVSEKMDYIVSEDDFERFHGLGYLQVVVSYEETGGIDGGPCDTVSVNIPPNGANADWQNLNIILSGTSDDCTDINLFIAIFPNYNNSEQFVIGVQPTSIIEQWSSNDYGSGVFNLNIDVDTNSVAPSPYPQDDNEEVTVTWVAHFFNANVEEV